MRERIQKLLAQCGIGSRREIERWIQEGRIKIDGRVAQLGNKIDWNDKISLDGKWVKLKNPTQGKSQIILYNKPEGVISTRSDPQGRTTVFAGLPKTQQRWILVGRLDLNSSGLLLFTNDGELAKRLMHPSLEIEREYAVRVFGNVSPECVRKLQKGIKLEDGVARFKEINFVGGEGTNRWYNVVLTEGRNREVRRLWQSQGITVSRLIRIRYGNVLLPRDLRQGQYRELARGKVALLMKLVDL
jgi:23S rRNA pseudouridine2605 synthase